MHAAISREANHVTVIRPVSERITRTEATHFHRQVFSSLDEGGRVVLDMRHVQYMDSVGFGVLMRLLKEARRRDGDIKLVSLTLPVMIVMEKLRLYTAFDVMMSVSEAVASYRPIAAGSPVAAPAAQTARTSPAA